MLFGQDEKPPNLWETINITVKPGHEEAFEAAVKAHNTKFHAEDGLYRAELGYNINGPHGGTYTWLMGPTSYTAMDSRPGKGDHDQDWKNVGAHVEKYGSPEYWSHSVKLSHFVEGQTNSKRLIWLYDIRKGQATRWAELVGKVKEVYSKKRPTENFLVVWNDFADTKAGRDAAVIFPFDKYAWMDRQSNFSKDYEEVHGAGTWHNFLNEFNDTIDGRVDWLREMID
jgi:hypothetical protein